MVVALHVRDAAVDQHPVPVDDAARPRAGTGVLPPPSDPLPARRVGPVDRPGASLGGEQRPEGQRPAVRVGDPLRLDPRPSPAPALVALAVSRGFDLAVPPVHHQRLGGCRADGHVRGRPRRRHPGQPPELQFGPGRRLEVVDVHVVEPPSLAPQRLVEPPEQQHVVPPHDRPVSAPRVRRASPRPHLLPRVGPGVEPPEVFVVVVAVGARVLAPEDVDGPVVVDGRVGAPRRGAGARGVDPHPPSRVDRSRRASRRILLAAAFVAAIPLRRPRVGIPPQHLVQHQVLPPVVVLPPVQVDAPRARRRRRREVPPGRARERPTRVLELGRFELRGPGAVRLEHGVEVVRARVLPASPVCLRGLSAGVVAGRRAAEPPLLLLETLQRRPVGLGVLLGRELGLFEGVLRLLLLVPLAPHGWS